MRQRGRVGRQVVQPGHDAKRQQSGVGFRGVRRGVGHPCALQWLESTRLLVM